MSQNASDIQQIAVADVLWLFTNYVDTSLAAVWIYEYILTLRMEIEAIWPQRLSATSLLFFANRYLFVGSIVVGSLSVLPVSADDAQCNLWLILDNIFTNLSIATTSLLFTLRVYAIYGQSRWVLFASIPLIFIRIVLSMWENLPPFNTGPSTKGTQFQAFSGCSSVVQNITVATDVQIATQALTLAFDALMLALTFKKTFSHAVQMHTNRQESITQVLLRDGIAYFLVMFLVNAGAMIINIMSIRGDIVSFGGNEFLEFVTPYQFTFSNMLVSRLVLNLRSYERPQSGERSAELLPELAFAQSRFLGNIGAPIDMDQWSHGVEGEADRSMDDERDDHSRSVLQEIGNQTTTLVPVIYNDSEEANGDNGIQMVTIERYRDEGRLMPVSAIG